MTMKILIKKLSLLLITTIVTILTSSNSTIAMDITQNSEKISTKNNSNVQRYESLLEQLKIEFTNIKKELASCCDSANSANSNSTIAMNITQNSEKINTKINSNVQRYESLLEQLKIEFANIKKELASCCDSANSANSNSTIDVSVSQEINKINLKDNATFQHYKTLVAQLEKDISNIKQKLTNYQKTYNYSKELSDKWNKLSNQICLLSKSFKYNSDKLKSSLIVANACKSTKDKNYAISSKEFLYLYSSYKNALENIDSNFKQLKKPYDCNSK